MSEYRYILEKGSKKHICPECGKKSFVRFIDSSTKEYLPAEYGRCDREINCGYFYKPDNKIIQPHNEKGNAIVQPRQFPLIKPAVYIPYEILKQSRLGYTNNLFVQYLIRCFGMKIAENLIKTYLIGSSNSRWPGACLFWFIDINGGIRAGQIKLFDETGHTTKYTTADNERKSCTSWIHSIIKYNHETRQETLPEWLTAYLNQGGNYASCFYGEHLLKQDSVKPVAIVEAPATAIVASVYLPDFIWLAAGSLSYLTFNRSQVLSGRRVYLFPDISKDGRAYELWSKKAKELSPIAAFTVSDLLERNTTAGDKMQGLDIRDYLTQFDYKLFQRERPQIFNDHSDKYIITIDTESFEIAQLVTLSYLGAQFNNHTIGTFRLTNADFCNILFDAAGETAKINDDISAVIYACIGNVFTPGQLNGEECLLQKLSLKR